jgi:hypothetical protein
VIGAALAVGTVSPAEASGREGCGVALASTAHPALDGLEIRRLSTEGGSAEGGVVQAFLRHDHRPAYIITETYGETGKRTALYAMGKDSTSFAAQITESAYAEPIHVGPPEVLQVRVVSFMVCKGEIVTGAGDALVPADTVQSSKSDVGRVFRLLSRDR